MNCGKYRNSVLLEQSDELGAIGRFLLARHLARCGGCRRFRAELLAVTHVARAASENASDAAVQSILDRARRERSRSEEIRFRPSRAPLGIQWRPAFVYAAIGLLVLGAFVAVIAPVMRAPVTQVRVDTPPADVLAWEGIDTEIAEIEELLQTASSDWNGQDPSGTITADELESLARELLQMEGT